MMMMMMMFEDFYLAHRQAQKVLGRGDPGGRQEAR